MSGSAEYLAHTVAGGCVVNAQGVGVQKNLFDRATAAAWRQLSTAARGPSRLWALPAPEQQVQQGQRDEQCQDRAEQPRGAAVHQPEHGFQMMAE